MKECGMISIRYVMIVIFLLGTPAHLRAISILASVFNATYSYTNPFVATTSTTIILDENIVMNTAGVYELFQAGGGFDPLTDTITFSSTTNSALVISTGTTWKVSIPFIFTGNAQLQLQAGASCWFNSGSVVLQDSCTIVQ
jgi:hypothetical protein